MHTGRAGSRCRRCVLDRELRTILADERGVVPAVLEPFRQYLLQTHNEQVIDWVRDFPPRLRAYFATVAAGEAELSEDTLCALANVTGTRDILSRLIAAKVFRYQPIEDVQTEAWLRRFVLPSLADAEREVLLTYFRFHALPTSLKRMRAHIRYSPQMSGFRAHARCAARFFRYLAAHHSSLALCSQRLLDAYAASLAAGERIGLATFLNWARRNRHCTIKLVSAPIQGESRTRTDEEMRAALARIDSAEIPSKVRIAATLHWLHGLALSTIVQLRGMNICERDNTTILQVPSGAEIFIVEPLRSQLLADLSANPSDWIFPSSRYPAHHMGPQTLKRAFRRIGLAHPAREVTTTAKRRLLAIVPAALAREVLGINSAAAAKATTTMASPSAQQYIGLRVRAARNNTP